MAKYQCLEETKSYRHSPDGFVVLPLIAAQLTEMLEGKYQKEFTGIYNGLFKLGLFLVGQVSCSGAVALNGKYVFTDTERGH